MSTAPAPVGTPEPMRHRFLTWPSTHDGKRAAWLGAGVLGLFAVDAALAALGAYDGGDAVRLVLGVTGMLAILGGIASLVFAVRGLRSGDRSLLLFWPLLLGAFAVLFVVGEFAFPH